MKLAIISDLHLDSWVKKEGLSGIPNAKKTLLDIIIEKCYNQADFIFIAGDFWNGAVEKLNTHNLPHNVLTVWGNHDYYGDEWPEESDAYATSIISGSEELTVSIATLWTHFKGNEAFAQMILKGISDSSHIKNVNADKMSVRSIEEKNFLLDMKSDIIMTHFPPSYQSCSPQFKGDWYNPYFLNDLDYEVFAAKLWICGHVHHKHHYMMGDTLVVCNPLGYGHFSENYSKITDYEPVIVENDENGNWRVITS